MREKLTMLQVKEPKSVGDKGAQMVIFQAKGADGKVEWYKTFRPSFFSAIKVDAEVDAEFEIKEDKERGYTDRVVSQIYIDGQPVAVKGFGGRGFSPGKSPEEITSIERQVAAKVAAELWIADKLGEDSKEVNALRSWLLNQLSAAPAAPTPDTKKPATKKPEPATKNLKVEFNKECKRLGWDVKTPEGLANIKAWLDQNGFVVPWERLTDEAQARAVKFIKEE